MEKQLLIKEICGLLENLNIHKLEIIRSFIGGIKK